ncbi:hypothetical protein Taro_003754 [Colocasia esculenta]|uniref:Uncharacterized protein n=1 Tax=Colocasia esculenta TaxID=4460 RepID=A0A843TN07_COLES|nr:hypothetical protein [Colocasia esculenta]
MNALVSGVAFRLSLFGADVCMCAACRAWSGAADVWREALLDPGEELLRLCWAIGRFSGVLVALSTRGRCMERGRRRAIASLGVLREGDGFRILRRRWFRLLIIVLDNANDALALVALGERGVEVELCSVGVVCLGGLLLRWCACEACGLGFLVIEWINGAVVS